MQSKDLETALRSCEVQGLLGVTPVSKTAQIELMSIKVRHHLTAFCLTLFQHTSR